jgi:hypothetical protein
LAGREKLKHGDKGERGGFAGFALCLRSDGGICGVGEEKVGIRVEPDDLAQPGRLWEFNVEHGELSGRASAG